MTSISITFELGRCLSQELLCHIYHLGLRSVLIPRYSFSQGCTFSIWSERKEILFWPSHVSSCVWWVTMVLQEGCHGVRGVPNGETSKEAMSMASACPVLPSSPIWPSSYREENRETQRTAVEGLRQQCMRGREGSPFQGCCRHGTGAGCQHELQGHCIQGWAQPSCRTAVKQPLTPPMHSYFLLLPVSFCLVLRHFIAPSYPMREQPCVASNPVQSRG